MTETNLPSIAPTPTWMLWIGRVLSALPVLFMGVGGTYTLFNPKQMTDNLPKQGIPMELAYTILFLQVGCALIYAIPQTAVLGAVLLTGYCGGAIMTHLRIGEYGMVTPAIVVGVMVWLGLFCRDARIRALLPLRRL